MNDTDNSNITCQRCNKQFKTVNSFLTHVARKYKLNSEQVYCEINHIIETPLCKCDCGEKVNFQTFRLGYSDYLRGHSADGSNFNKTTRDKAAETYRQNLASGKTTRTKKEKLINSTKEFKCPGCLCSYDTIVSLSKHWTKTHKLTTANLWLQLNGLTEIPRCKCGCRSEVTFLDAGRGFNEFILGHAARVNNNYQTEKSINNSLETRQKMLQDGTWKPFISNETGEHWSKGLTKETDERVAKMSETIIGNHNEVVRRSEQMKQQWVNESLYSLHGSEHPNWAGGVSSLNIMCRNNTKLYKEWKYPKLSKSNFKCELCQRSDNLAVHHDKESFSTILREIAKEKNWEENLTSKTSPDDIMLFELKQEISETVADYHIKNNVSGIVLCDTCHKTQHNKHNI